MEKKKNKLQRDLETGFTHRWISAANINKKFSGGVELLPVHPHLKGLTPVQKREYNTVYNRFIDSGDGQGMGLDFELSCEASTKKVRVLIRWFDDPDIYLKDSGERDLAKHYDKAVLLILNRPVHGQTTHYKLLPLSGIYKLGYEWRKADRLNNSNRLILTNFNGQSIKPGSLHAIPVEGAKRIFGADLDIWTALKNLCK